MPRPILIDFYCCAGGGGRGYHDVGFEVIGVDKDPQPRYPFELIQGDAIELMKDLARCHSLDGIQLADIAGIHASPPCQHDSVASKSHNGRPQDHPDLIGPTQELLDLIGKPFIIENVEGARSKLRNPIMLCGTMFDSLRVKRHRYFEANFPLVAPLHQSDKHPLHYTRDKRKPHYGQLDEMTAFVSVNGGGNCSREAAADAMQIDWMTKNELNEAIPPAYTRYLGIQMLNHIRGAA